MNWEKREIVHRGGTEAKHHHVWMCGVLRSQQKGDVFWDVNLSRSAPKLPCSTYNICLWSLLHWTMSPLLLGLDPFCQACCIQHVWFHPSTITQSIPSTACFYPNFADFYMSYPHHICFYPCALKTVTAPAVTQWVSLLLFSCVFPSPCLCVYVCLRGRDLTCQINCTCLQSSSPASVYCILYTQVSSHSSPDYSVCATCQPLLTY